MECPHLEINEFGEAECHHDFEDSECPKECFYDCPVKSEYECPGYCPECNHQWECENSDRMDDF